ncbi:MAG: 50S ribosomal protein L4 [Nanoarchaeota archaeon]|nr:50S ribosomal protein L4 [Nanoarchaeota archaeon]
MKAKIYDKTGNAIKEIELPVNFSSPMRYDILQKTFEAKKVKQAMGNFPWAGMLYSASGILKHRRHAWKTAYGKGISRIPRKIMSRSGDSFNWVGATVANTRGGRQAHPPKAEENQFRKINKKEMTIAFNSAFTGTANNKYIEEKYKIKTDILPVIFNSEILNLKTKEFLGVLRKIFKDASEKILKKRAVRAGKGKTRGRKYKRNAGLLFVIASDEEMKRTGIDVVKVKDLQLRNLAPNGQPGRFAGYTEKAIKEIGEKFK